MVVKQGMPWLMAVRRMEYESSREVRPSGVLTTRTISPLFIRSTMWGRTPSVTLYTRSAATPPSSRQRAVPSVEDVKAEVGERLTEPGKVGFIRIPHAEENLPLKRQRPARRDLGLGEGAAEVSIDSHHLARGLHLRAKNGIDPAEFHEGKHRLLHGHVAQAWLPGEPELFQRHARHDLCGQLGQGDPRCLADEGDRPGGPGVHLEDIDGGVLDGELDVDQAHHLKLQG